MTKRLVKSRTDRKLTGVCGGIAEYLGWDATLVRTLYVILILMFVGAPVILYFVLALIMPDERPPEEPQNSSSKREPSREP
ncbi:MAG: PspC domain-containing protein [Balneolaceae bacterium]